MHTLKTIWLVIVAVIDVCAWPCLYHAERFPFSRDDIKSLCAFNRSYQEKLWKQYEVWPGDEITRMSLREAELLWKAWNSLDDARNEMFSPWRRRKALSTLLGIIGPEAFMNGEMPYHVPMWRFVEVRQ